MCRKSQFKLKNWVPDRSRHFDAFVKKNCRWSTTFCKVPYTKFHYFVAFWSHRQKHTRTRGLPFNGFSPKFDTSLQLWYKGHISNFIFLACCVLESLCSQTNRQVDIQRPKHYTDQRFWWKGQLSNFIFPSCCVIVSWCSHTECKGTLRLPINEFGPEVDTCVQFWF